MRACTRANSCAHCTTSLTVVLAGCGMVREGGFILFSFRIDCSGISIYSSRVSHRENEGNEAFFAFSGLFIAQLISATVVHMQPHKKEIPQQPCTPGREVLLGGPQPVRPSS